MILRADHPEVADRVCEVCILYMHNEKTGEILMKEGRDANGNEVKMKIERKGTKPPCEIKGKGCPKGHWSNPIELSRRNEQAYLFHKECQSVGRWPDDDIVRMNGRIIDESESAAKQMRMQKQLGLLGVIATLSGALGK